MNAPIIGGAVRRVLLLALLCACPLAVALGFQSEVVDAAGATTSVRIARYAADGETVLQERTVTYKWMQSNLPVQGDGVTHYYHQGPVFEGDVWDPDETVNLKDKGAVKGTDVRDLCELVGSMSTGEEVMLRAVDGYSLEFLYANVYEPLPRQGPLVLCWYKGEEQGKPYGFGYPGNDGYSDAIQLVFMAETTNGDGKHVFGNTDMLVCLPDDKYRHYYDGLPSTNGLSGKWISEVLIYSEEQPVVATPDPTATENRTSVPWVVVGLGIPGLVLLSAGGYFLLRSRFGR